MKRTGLALLATVGLWFTVAAASRAQSPAPSDAAAPAKAAASPAPAVPPVKPMTAPATAPVDPSTPKGALKSLTRALEAGDRDDLLDLLDAESPAEQRIAEATAGLAEASAQLRQAAVKAFGEQAAQPLGNSSAVPEAMARIDSSTEAIDGDKATVTSPQDQGEKLSLVRRRADGKWQVPVSQFAGPADDATVDQTLRASSAQSQVLKDLTAEVSAGRFKSAVEARQELNKRIMQLAMPGVPPATTKAATTAPAAAPAPAPPK